MTSRGKIYLGSLGMALAMAGDYLLGVNSIGTSSNPDALYGIAWNVVPDWRYAVSSVLGFLAVPLFAIAAMELFRVMEGKSGLRENRLYKLFKLANWAGILYFAFVHIGICMLPVVFNAGMEATGETAAAVGMTLRVARSIIVPLAISFIVADGFVTVAWIGIVVKGKLPLRKLALLCNPVVIALVGQLLNFLPLPFEGVDSGFESLGWLLMYAVCARRLAQ